MAVVTGNAVGPAWVALCNADLTIAVEGCTIAPLAPQAAVSVLYKDEIDSSDNIAAATQKKAAQWAAETCSAAAALQKLLQNDYRERFFDINLRQNYYSAEMIDASLKAATVFKISREEIGVLGINGDAKAICRETAKKYPNLRLILVTLDKDGAFAFDCAGQAFYPSPRPAAKAVSTVGAGDSFSAGFLVSYLAGKDIKECLTRATALSDYVVTQLGAVPEYPEALRKAISL